MISANVTRAAVLVSTIAFAGIFGFSPSAAQEASADVGHVAAVSGRVVALVRGTPSLLDTADVISDRARLDVLANSELQVCHHRLQRFVTMSGPADLCAAVMSLSLRGMPLAVLVPGCDESPTAYTDATQSSARTGMLSKQNTSAAINGRMRDPRFTWLDAPRRAKIRGVAAECCCKTTIVTDQTCTGRVGS
jgi:hypothetical protein